MPLREWTRTEPTRVPGLPVAVLDPKAGAGCSGVWFSSGPLLGGNLLPWGPILAWGMCPTEMESQTSPGPRNCLGCETLPPTRPSSQTWPESLQFQTPGSRLSGKPCGVSTPGVSPSGSGPVPFCPPRCLCPLCRRRVAQVGTTVAGQAFGEHIPGLSTSNHYPNLKTSDLRLREANK